MQTPTEKRPTDQNGVPLETNGRAPMNNTPVTTKKSSPWVPIAIVAALLVAGLFVKSKLSKGSDAARQSAGAARDNTRSVYTVPVVTGTIVENINITGQLRSNQSVDLNAKISGRVAKVLVNEGDRVRRGQLVVQLDTSDLQQSLDAARANLQQQQVALQQTKVGLPARIAQVSTSIAQAKAALVNAKAGVATAQARYKQALLNEPAQITNTKSQVATAKAQLASSQAALKVARDTANQTKGQVEGAITLAKASLGQAQAQLEQVKNGSREQEIATAQAQVNLNQANLKNAETNLNRNKQLFAGGATAQANVDTAQTQYDVAKAQLDASNQQLSLVKAGSRTEEVSAAEQVVNQREAALQQSLSDRNRILAAQSQVTQAIQAVAQSQQGLLQAEANQANIPITRQETAAAAEAVRQAQSQVRTAEATLNQAIANQTQIPVARADVPAAQAKVAAAQTEVQQAILNLGYANITSPVNGVVNTKATDVGETAQPGTSLMNLVALDSVYFEAQVPETQLASIKVGQPARVTVTAVSNEPVVGYVSEIIPVADQQLRQFRVRISLPQGKGMTPGAFARGVLQTQVINNTMTVPEAVIHTQDGKSVLYVAVPDGKTSVVKVKEVKVGASAGGKVQILGGVNNGDQIVSGTALFNDGDKIRISKDQD